MDIPYIKTSASGRETESVLYLAGRNRLYKIMAKAKKLRKGAKNYVEKDVGFTAGAGNAGRILRQLCYYRQCSRSNHNR